MDTLEEKRKTTKAPKGSALTGRELEVLVQLSQGQRNRELAQALVISEATVINHLHSIFRKLGVKSRTEAVIYALTHDIGMIQPK